MIAAILLTPYALLSLIPFILLSVFYYAPPVRAKEVPLSCSKLLSPVAYKPSMCLPLEFNVSDLSIEKFSDEFDVFPDLAFLGRVA